MLKLFSKMHFRLVIFKFFSIFILNFKKKFTFACTMSEEKEEIIRILYVDDEINNLNSFKATFRRDYEIYTAENAMDGIKMLEEHTVDIIITDQRMPNMTGVEFLEKIIPIHPNPIRILLTGFTDVTAVIDAINKGQVYHYLNKPWVENDIRLIIKNAFEVHELKRKNKELNENLTKVNKQLEFLLRQQLIS